MTDLRKIIQNLLDGLIITSTDDICILDLFCHGGHVWLRALEKKANIYIIDEYKTKTIRLYGSEEACHSAHHSIMEYLQNAEREAVKVFNLDNGENSRTLLRAIIQKYDVELRDFIDACGLRSAELDIRRCCLTLQGSEDSIEEATELLEKLEEESDSDGVQDTCPVKKLIQSDQDKCPVCLGAALTRTFRLENCGHLYCGPCIKGHLNTMQTPPLECCAVECGKKLILEDIRRLFDYNTENIREFLRKSLRHYIAHNAFVYCPAPECSMFVDPEKVPADGKWNCPLCHNDICIKCRVIYHQSLSCEMYQHRREIEVFVKNNKDVKNCPNCGVTIQKNGGCLHMTCYNCKKHFCWPCLKLFATDREVDRHQPDCPERRK